MEQFIHWMETTRFVTNGTLFWLCAMIVCIYVMHLWHLVSHVEWDE